MSIYDKWYNCCTKGNTHVALINVVHAIAIQIASEEMQLPGSQTDGRKNSSGISTKELLFQQTDELI